MTTWFDYRDSRRLDGEVEASYYALLMLVMRRSDTANVAKLKAAFPDVYDQLQRRYDAPGGVLPEDPPGIRELAFGGQS